MQITLQINPWDKDTAMDVYYAIGDSLAKHGKTIEVNKHGDEDIGWEITINCHEETWESLTL